MGHVKTAAASRLGLSLLLAAGFGFAANGASALRTDDNVLIEGAKLCTRYLPRHERDYGIPEHLLAAIASTESGRFHKALGLNLPWPWTINVEGQGHFYDTKEEAISAVREYQSRGFMSIDVGCMQVNLIHHPNAFASLEQAFDPAYNVAYAAHFLRQNFDEEGSWRKAAADYHSRTPIYGEEYANLVYGAWGRIINKVADARAGRPILNTAALHASPAFSHVGSYHPVHMHSISIGRDTTRENGVIVVRPEYVSPNSLEQASLDSNDFVSHPISTHKVSPELSAMAPAGVAALRNSAAAQKADDAQANHGAQVVKVRSDGTTVPSQGQFEPSAHVVRATGNSASTPGASVSSPTSMFVFDN